MTIPASPARSARPPRRLGLRREVLILLPVALLLLVVLSTFTLVSYRNAIALLAGERQQEAARVARAVADRLAASAGPAVPSPLDLRQPAPSARGVALVDARGQAIAILGELPAGGLLDPAGGRPITQPVGFGPDDSSPDTVIGFAPLGRGADRRYVRVDLPARVLARQRRSLAVLTVAVMSINAALAVLLLFFLRHLLSPWETLLARARQVGGAGAAGEDEIDFLLSTFDRALTSLAGRQGRSPEDDIAALERTLSASLRSGLLLIDREGRVLALNAVGAALLGAELPEPGAPLAQVLAGQPELREILEVAVAEGTAPQRQECAVRPGPDGAEALTVGLTVHPLRRDDGEVRGLLVLFADLTEAQRRAEEGRLAESLAQLGEMAGGVAHELRNGLATLRGYLTLIERRPDEDSIADFLSEIRGEADHLERVLQDFLSFARPGTARVRELSLDRLLRRAAADPALDGVEVCVQGEDVVLRGDPQLLERAVRNLLHNAVEAEREAGRRGPIEVAIALEPEGVEIAIEDRGPGLPDEIRERLFHPFATGRRGGVGLGLALAHRIVVLHGGRIRLDDRPGGGTRALLFFPRDTIVTMSNEAPPEREAAPGS
ncbi:MAG TPA: ATP-binding protein [Thermoanaerobaculia bacterium]|jgi:signal transduction histidine kinase|nr:ATP-binding protein [Thermoanaerobaculia bacterium]